MTTREEITVELGVNNTTLGRGLAQADSMVGTFADKVTHKIGTKFNKFLFGGIAGLVVGFAHELISTEAMGKFWDWVYGVDADGAERTKKMQEHFKKLREEVESLTAKEKQTREDYLYKNESNAGKQAMLDEKITKNAEDQAKAVKEIQYAEEFMSDLRKFASLDEQTREKWITKQAEAKKRLLDLEIESYKLADKDAELKKKIADEETQRMRRIEELRIKDYSEISKFMPTLEELSHRGRFQREARDIERFSRRAKRDFMRGNVAAAIDDIGQANTIYDKLSGLGVLPARNKSGADRAADALESIVKGQATINTKAKMS